MKRIVLAAVLVVACGKKADEQKETPKSTEKAAPATAKVEKKAAEPTPPPVTEEQRRAYRTHLRAGRKLGKEKRWGEAVVEFEAALAAIPMDGRALSELGWAAFQAGDYDKAKKTNQDSARVASDPKVKAASLYNLGRVAEALKEPEAAARHYRESLKLRPHKAVKARLEKLGKPAPEPWVIGEDELPCTEPSASPQKTCECLNAHHRAAAEEEFDESCEQIEVESPAEVGVARVRISDLLEFEFYLLYETAQGWVVVADLALLYEGGVAGVYNEMEVTKIEKKKVGARNLLWVEVEDRGYDNDPGVNEIAEHRTLDVTLCVLAEKGAPTCSAKLPLSASYSRDVLDEEADEDARPEDLADLHTPGLPYKVERVFEVRLGEDGKATLVLKKGEVDEATKELLGPHQLW